MSLPSYDNPILLLDNVFRLIAASLSYESCNHSSHAVQQPADRAPRRAVVFLIASVMDGISVPHCQNLPEYPESWWSLTWYVTSWGQRPCICLFYVWILIWWWKMSIYSIEITNLKIVTIKIELQAIYKESRLIDKCKFFSEFTNVKSMFDWNLHVSHILYSFFF